MQDIFGCTKKVPSLFASNVEHHLVEFSIGRMTSRSNLFQVIGTISNGWLPIGQLVLDWHNLKEAGLGVWSIENLAQNIVWISLVSLFN